MSDIDEIVDWFPNPIINPIVGIPTYKSISEIHIKLNSNAASIYSELDNGALGLLALVITPVVHNTLEGVPFVPPSKSRPNLYYSTKVYMTIDCYPLPDT